MAEAQEALGTPVASPSATDGSNVYIETYGCQMNTSDSQVVESLLRAAGFAHVASEHDADVVLLNTCAIRDKAEARIWGRLQQLHRMKQHRREQQHARPGPVVGVLGCMAQRLKEQLLAEGRLAQIVAGPDAYRDLPSVIRAVQGGEAAASLSVALSLEETYADVAPVRRSGAVSAFVSIMRGCNNLCAFCIVPFVRGRERSRPAGSILREAEQLARDGVREVVLLGQNVNSYADWSHLQQEQQDSAGPCQVGGGTAGRPAAGAATPFKAGHEAPAGTGAGATAAANGAGNTSGVYAPGFSSVYVPRRAGAVGFADLLRAVARVDRRVRVRFTSPHPKEFSHEVLQVIAEHPNICKQLHMPAQSGSSSALQRMRRGYSRAAYDALLADVRARLPGVAISTDIIAGFCGETEEEHADTLDLMRTASFDNASMFAYSERGKTHAARHLPDDVPRGVKQRRLQEVMAAFREALQQRSSREVGRVHLVLVEGGAPKQPGAWTGRACTGRKATFPQVDVPSALTALPDLPQLAAAAAGRTPLQPQRPGDAPAEAEQPGTDGSRAGGCSSAPQARPGQGGGMGMGDAGSSTRCGHGKQQQQLQQQLPGVGPDDGGSGSSSRACSYVPLAPGDYVAVRVVGCRTTTLLCDPLARTTIDEFVGVFGSSVPQGRAHTWRAAAGCR